MSKSLSRTVLAAIAAMTFVGTGCDSTSSDGLVVLTFSTDNFSFDFDSSNITVNQAQRIVTATQVDIESFLNSQGYSKADLQSATVEQASVEVLFPVDENLAFVDEVVISLTAPGAVETAVASRSGFTGSDVAQLTVDDETDVAFLVGRSSFSAVLDLTINTIRNLDPYELELAIQVRLEVAES